MKIRNLYIIIATLIGSQFFLSCQIAGNNNSNKPIFESFHNAFSFKGNNKVAVEKKIGSFAPTDGIGEAKISWSKAKTSTFDNEALRKEFKIFNTSIFSKQSELSYYKCDTISNKDNILELHFTRKADAKKNLTYLKVRTKKGVPSYAKLRIEDLQSVYQSDKELEVFFNEGLPFYYKIKTEQSMIGRDKTGFLVEGKIFYKKN